MVIARLYPGLYLVANGMAYAIVAWLFLTEPLAWFARLQIDAVDPAAYTELKATYVGLMGSLGIYFLAAGLTASLRQSAVLLAILSYAGLAAVRAWGIYLNGNSSALMQQLLAVEVTDLAAGLLALYCLRRTMRQPRNPYF
ncbi:MAG: hypothetical protein R3F41_15945 [Gammaproteobacteria bacterium]|nr:hypothetical protein [Pseudomonadales bacterium]MCP5346736.1 hypothetical protein [Pseudomonadales bacterium]